MADAIVTFLVFVVGLLTGRFLKYCICRFFHIQMSKGSRWLESGNGLLYVLVFLSEKNIALAGMFCVCASILLVVGIIDYRTFEIPVPLNLLIGGLGIMHLFLDLEYWQTYLIGTFAASSLLWLLHLISRGKGMGGGDIKLMAVSGLLLGWKKIVLALLVGAAAGTVIHLMLMRFGGKKRVLAFGPYLALGIFTAMLYGDRILDWYLLNFG